MRWKSLGILGLLTAALLLSAATPGETVTRLQALDWEGETLVLRLDGPYESRSFSMEEPDRLVIDFPGVRSALRSHQLPGRGAVAAIRVGQNEADTDSGLRCRIVLDLSTPQHFELDREESVLRVMPRTERATVPATRSARAHVELTASPEPAADVAAPTPSPAGTRQEFVETPTPAARADHETAPATPPAPLLAAGATVTATPAPGDAMSTPPWERDGEEPRADGAPEPDAPAATPAAAPDAVSEATSAAAPVPDSNEPVFMMTQYGPVPVSIAETPAPALKHAASAPVDEAPAPALKHAAPVPAAEHAAPLPVDEAPAAKHDEPAPTDAAPTAEAASDAPAPVDEVPAAKPAAPAPVDEIPAAAKTAKVTKATPAVRQGPPLPPAVDVASAEPAGTGSETTPRLKVTSETVRAEPVQDTAPPEMEAAVQAPPAKARQANRAAPAPDATAPAAARQAVTATTAAAKTPAAPARYAATPAAATPPAAISLGPGAKTPEAPITLDIRGAEFRTLLAAFSEFSGQNIITGRDVKGKVSVQLKGVPWKQALYAICEAHGFGVVEEYGVIRVASRQSIIQEEMERLTNEKKRVEYQPLETGVVKLHYAMAAELTDPLGKMLSERGKVDVDERTNSLLVTDLTENVARVIQMAHELDHIMPQVEIKARIVDVDYRASRDLGVHWLAENLVSDPLDAVGSIEVNGEFPDPVAQVKLGTVQDWGQLSVTLQALERDNKANIISNPHVMTMDNREASILVGKKIPLIVADEAGNAITQLTTIGIKLQVTPHINPEGKIMMNLHTEVSDLASEATVQGGVIITTSESTNEVMVTNGETAVIGGLIKSSDSKLRDGVPVLSKIPIMGRLFSYQNDSESKRELFIFITPTIIQPQSASSAALPSEFIEDPASF
ncbi:MAG: AMIN domain-containing protein [Candidatus Krumholzibacteriota bacterium]|nr:AMIN domain-containing protein [Candidatus Krumholzibacteriota bacterium]